MHRFIFTHEMKFNAVMTMLSSLMLSLSICIHHVPALVWVNQHKVMVTILLLGLSILGPTATMLYFKFKADMHGKTKPK